MGACGSRRAASYPPSSEPPKRSPSPDRGKGLDTGYLGLTVRGSCVRSERPLRAGGSGVALLRCRPDSVPVVRSGGKVSQHEGSHRHQHARISTPSASPRRSASAATRCGSCRPGRPENLESDGLFVDCSVTHVSRDHLGLLAQGRVFRSALWNGEAARATDRLVDEFRPDVVHTHKLYPQLSVAPVVVAARRGVPVVQTLHDFEMLGASPIDVRGGWWDRDEPRLRHKPNSRRCRSTGGCTWAGSPPSSPSRASSASTPGVGSSPSSSRTSSALSEQQRAHPGLRGARRRAVPRATSAREGGGRRGRARAEAARRPGDDGGHRRPRGVGPFRGCVDGQPRDHRVRHRPRAGVDRGGRAGHGRPLALPGRRPPRPARVDGGGDAGGRVRKWWARGVRRGRRRRPRRPAGRRRARRRSAGDPRRREAVGGAVVTRPAVGRRAAHGGRVRRELEKVYEDAAG